MRQLHEYVTYTSEIFKNLIEALINSNKQIQQLRTNRVILVAHPFSIWYPIRSVHDIRGH